MHQSFVFSGFGGQGVMFVGQLLGYAAMDAGLETTWIPSYGPEMRGGTAHCFVVISDQVIGSPLVRQPDVAVVFNQPSFDKYLPLIAPDGLLVCNASLVANAASDRDDLQIARIPGTELAEDLGNVRLTNMVLLGAMLALRSVLSIEMMQRSLAEHIPAHRRSMLDLNCSALKKGAEFALVNTPA